MIDVLRKVLILGALAALLWAAETLRSARDFDTGTLPAGLVTLTLGLLLIAAHVVGRILAARGLPLITGYLLAGFVLGPELLGIVTATVSDRLEVITQIALGLIALTAGGELELGRLRPRMRGIAWITALQTLGIFLGTLALVPLATMALERAGMAPALTAGMTQPQVLVVALILALVATVNSPASAVAVINETGARGPLATMALGVTVFKDVIVIILLGVVLTASRLLLDPEEPFELATLAGLGGEIGLSLAAGGALGAALIGYLVKVNREVPLFLLGSVVVAVQAVEAVERTLGIHLHFLIVCMVAGFLVQNLSPRGRTLIEGVERSSMPIYVVFFAMSGAALHLGALGALLPMAVALALWRAGLTFAATWGGARLAGEDATLRRNGWTAFLPQAGVTLGIAALVAARFPEIGGRLHTLILALVAINELVGPVLFKWGLLRAGEYGAAARTRRGDTT